MKLCQSLDRNWKMTQLYQIDALWMYRNYPPYLKCVCQVLISLSRMNSISRTRSDNGFSISPIVANLYMEHFESRALDTAPTRPSMWYCHVDDTMTKIHECAVSSLSDHLNSINPHIQFTSEEEKNGRIPFLDTCLHVNEDGLSKVTVYRKPTRTDQYLNFQSNHHLQHKRAVVNSELL